MKKKKQSERKEKEIHRQRNVPSHCPFALSKTQTALSAATDPPIINPTESHTPLDVLYPTHCPPKSAFGVRQLKHPFEALFQQVSHKGLHVTQEEEVVE